MTRRVLTAVLGFILLVCAPVVAGAQITSAGNGVWTSGATWVGGVVPDSTDNVLIAAGDTITVNDYDARCDSLTFGGNDAQIMMEANSLLTVYGDFTLFSTSHCVFDSLWSPTDAKIKFAGSKVQTLSGWNTLGGSTSFRDVIIDKPAGKVTTGGNNMRLGIQNSLEIINGTFELAVGDDIEGRWATSGNYTYLEKPDVVIHAGAELDMVDGDGAHHIRSGYSGGIHARTGIWTVYGWARFVDASTNKLNLAGMDIEAGGRIVTSTGNSGGQLNFGPIHVKAGGEVTNYTYSDIYDATVVFTLDDGAVFNTKSSSTVFPATFINNGTVSYTRDSSEQAVATIDYRHLLIDVSDFNKTWGMTGNSVVTGDMTVANDATLIVTAAAPQSITVNGQLDVSAGSFDASDPNVSIVMGSAATLVESDTTRVVGTVKTTRTASQGVNETFGGIGLELNAAGGVPGPTEVVRVSGVALSISGNPTIERYFDVTPTNNSGLDATVVFHYHEAELNAIPESSLEMYSSPDSGSTWSDLNGTLDTVANTVTGSGIDDFSRLTLASEGLVGVPSIPPGTAQLLLHQNHPNPFSRSTTISFALPKADYVTIDIFDPAGRRVVRLLEGVKPAGPHTEEWRAVDGAGRRVASGVYFYRISTDSGEQITKKMMIVR
jgi:hypothetical protein